MLEKLLLKMSHLCQASLVPCFLRKLGGNKGLHNFACDFLPDDTCSETEHIHVVVFNALVGRVMIVTQPSANAREFVGRDAHPHAAAADDNGTLDVTAAHCVTSQLCKVWIVVFLSRVMGSQVNDLVTGTVQIVHDDLLQPISCVICCNGNLHSARTPSSLPSKPLVSATK
jgi:hypothetical protein